MFSKAVVGSARFMKMPVDSQNLYFHLGMAADDDGVVEAWSVLKTTGSAEDNLKVLASKGFIRVLNEDLVSYILDWNEHNMMRADRITPSAYRELLIQVVPDVDLAEPKQRADRPLRLGRPGDNHGTAEGRVGEDRIGNISAVATAPRVSPSFGGEGDSVPIPKKEKDANLDRSVKYWRELCKRKTDLLPSTGIPTIKRVLNNAHAHLTWPQIKQKMDEWFDVDGLQDHEKIQITRCFSTVQIDTFKAENV